MQEHNTIHCTDFSEGEMSAYKSNIIYSKLFGKGRHDLYQLTTEELKETDREATSSNFQKVMLSFHFIGMYKDAARLKIR